MELACGLSGRDTLRSAAGSELSGRETSGRATLPSPHSARSGAPSSAWEGDAQVRLGIGASAIRSPRGASEALSEDLPSALRELALLSEPAPLVRGVIEATCIVLGYSDASWPACKQLLSDPGTFLERMRTVETTVPAVPPHPRLLGALDAGSPEEVRGLCPAATPLMRWLRMLRWRADGFAALTAAGLETMPDLFTLTPDALRSVTDLTVRRRGVAEVIFHGIIDLFRTEAEGLAELPSIVRLAPGEVSVYPKPLERPPAGEGFNRSATVTLYGCYPPRHMSTLLDAESKELYREEIARRTEAKGAQFIDYDADRGVWQFSVDHF